jgi:hypothetical protein
LTQHGAALTYCFIMEGNQPSNRLFDGQGFRLHRDLVVPILAVGEEMYVAALENPGIGFNPATGVEAKIFSMTVVEVKAAEVMKETEESGMKQRRFFSR